MSSILVSIIFWRSCQDSSPVHWAENGFAQYPMTTSRHISNDGSTLAEIQINRWNVTHQSDFKFTACGKFWRLAEQTNAATYDIFGDSFWRCHLGTSFAPSRILRCRCTVHCHTSPDRQRTNATLKNTHDNSFVRDYIYYIVLYLYCNVLYYIIFA